MKKSIKVLVVFTLVLTVSLIGKYSTTSVKAAITPSTTQIQKIAKDSISKNLNIDIKESSESVKVDKVKAIELAKVSVGSVYSTKASSITAELSRFTDKQNKKLPNSDVSTQDIPAWIVTFHNVAVQTHGGFNQSNKLNITTDMNAVINANTGEEVEIFSYK